MARYKCDLEGIGALRKLAADIRENIETIEEETKQQKNVISEYVEVLGPHHQSLVSTIYEIQIAIRGGISPAVEMADMLMDVAQGYEDIINDNPFASLDVSENSGGNSQKGETKKSEGAFTKGEGLSSWKSIHGDHSYKDDMKAVNPLYDESSYEWAYNCQRCVPAYEMRQRGYDVQAKARPTVEKKNIWGKARKELAEDYLSRHPFDAWIPSETIHCPEGQLSIERQMQEWGDGSRAEVMVLWENEGGAGHVFVAQQIDGVTHYIDPQSGKEAVAYYFDYCEKNNIYICRTDNKEPSHWILDCCE